MRVLTSDPGSVPGRVVAILGLGMIGSAICDALQLFGCRREMDLDFAWGDRNRQKEAVDRLVRHLETARPRAPRFTLVWSAGAAGFAADEAEIALEQEQFESAVEWFHRCGVVAEAAPAFHFVSSAGGLFEGQRLVRRDSEPAPARAYGRMKLRQEERLERLSAQYAVRIYRPSSVYGVRRNRDERKGLVNNLLLNAAEGRVSTLDACLYALRDYVFAGDVGRFVAERILDDRGVAGCERDLLATGRSASICEVKNRIERLLRRPVHYRLDARFGNHEDITFHHRALPRAWRPVSLDAGLRRVLMQMTGQALPGRQ